MQWTESLTTASSTHHVECASAACLSDAVSIWPDATSLVLSLVLLALVGTSLLLTSDRILDFHSPIINLSQVVVFDGASSRRSTIVNHSSSTDEGAEFVGVKSGTNKGSALAEELLEILSSHDSGVDVSDFDLSLGESTLDGVDSNVVGLLLVALTLSLVGYRRRLWVSLSQAIWITYLLK